MSILFIGGELEDVTAVGGSVTFNTSTGHRTAYARGKIDSAGSTTQTVYAKINFTASSNFSVTGRFSQTTTFTANAIFLSLADSGNVRLRLRTSSATPTTLYLDKFDGTTSTTLATSTSTIAASGVNVYKIDVLVNYSASGYVRVYVDQVEYINYSGNVTAGGSTTLDELRLSGAYTAGTGGWSEIIVADEDTRPLSVKTLAPNGAGDASAWTGAYTDVDEITADSADLIVSGTAAQETNFECTGMPAGAANLSVRMVKVVASAVRGSGGPQKIQIGVKSGSTSGYTADIALTTGYTTVGGTWTTNPATGSAFTSAELDGLKLAIKSIA